MAKIASTFSTVKKDNSSKGNGRQKPYNEQAEIEKLAYQFFVDRGYEHGHDQEDWVRAEAVTRSRRS